jgi:hypothetical protein
MNASYHNVRTLNSYFNPVPRQQMDELYYGGPRGDNYFKILGAKYLICKDCSTESIRGYNYFETKAGYDLYVTDDVLPHYYIVHQKNGEFDYLADFTSKVANADLRKGILFTEPNVFTDLAAKTDSILVDSSFCSEGYRSNNRSHFTVMSNTPGVFVLNEFYTELWRVTVDGVKIKSLKVNGNQIGVPFSAGSHFIEFRYSPKIFHISLIFMLVGIIALYLYIRALK